MQPALPYEDFIVMENWKDIVGYEGLYQVSDLGNVRSMNYARSGCIRNLCVGDNGWGYEQVGLSIKGKNKTKKVHRLVAKAFILNVDNKREINHKDGCKTNNNVNNLERCTRKENVRYAYDVLGYRGSQYGRTLGKCNASKKILQYTLEGEFITEFDSLTRAARSIGMSISGISQCLTGKYKTGGGYVWKYNI